MSAIEQKLREAGITLPEPVVPVGNYALAVRHEQLVYLSGHLCRRDGKPVVGRLGENIPLEQGYELSRLVALDLMSSMRQLLGTLDAVERIIKLSGMVKSTPNFQQQSSVINGASDLFAVLWGEAGIHARSAIGVPELPSGAAVEIEMICSVEPGR